MKKFFVLTALAAAAVSAHAQTADVNQSSQTNSAANSSSLAIGGGQATSQINSSIGGSRATARGGAGGNAAGGSSNSNVTVNLGSGDPAGANGSGAGAVQNAQNVPGAGGTIHERVTTVGNPGAMSFGVSFSQYNCANTAGVGVGFMGGAVQLGGGRESDPCNARANASALFSIAQALASTNQQLSAQLFHAAVLLIGNSTKDTQTALANAGVSDWAAVSQPMQVNPPAVTTPVPDESRATPVPNPAVAVAPLPAQVLQPAQPVAVVAPAPVQAEPIPVVPAPEPVQPVVQQEPLDHPLTADEVKAIMYKQPAPAPVEQAAPDTNKIVPPPTPEPDAAQARPTNTVASK